MVVCSRCTYPSIHLFVSKSWSVVRGALVCFVCIRVLVLVLVFGGGVVWCFVVWFVFVCICFVFLFSSFFLFALSLFLSSLFFPLLSLLLSPPNTMERTDQPTRRPTSSQLNVIWRRASAQQSVLSLFVTPPSSLLTLFFFFKKKEETFFNRNFFGQGIIFHYRFILIQKIAAG